MGFRIKTLLDDDYRDAMLDVNVETQGKGTVQLTFLDENRETTLCGGSNTLECEDNDHADGRQARVTLVERKRASSIYRVC